MIEHFGSQTLSIANCPEDELGVGYEFLIKKFADDSGHTAAEFYTNRTVVHLMTELLEPQPGESIYDPTCGSAGMLLSAVSHLNDNNLSIPLYVREKRPPMVREDGVAYGEKTLAVTIDEWQDSSAELIRWMRYSRH